MIVSLKEMLQEADKGRYAVGAFNCLSLENVEGAIAAAEELRVATYRYFKNIEK